MKQNKKPSFYTLLAVVLFCTTTLLMSLQTWYNYNETQTRLESEIKKNAQTSLKQIEKTIAPYIHAFSMAEYLKIIENEMENQSIFAIVIEDYKMGNILGKEFFLSGKIRDEKWNILALDPNNKKQMESLKEQSYRISNSIIDQNQKTIAKIAIYSTNKFMSEQLRKVIVRDVIISLVIYFIFLFILYLMFHYLFLKPITRMIESLEKTDKNYIPKTVYVDDTTAEIHTLSTTISKMMETIKESRKAQSDQKKELQMIFDHSKDGIYIMDLESNFLNFNESYLKITGYTREELLKKSCLELTISTQRERAIEAIKEVIEKKQLVNFEKICISKSGKQLNINMSLALLPDRKRVLVTVKDMTHIKLLESKAKLAAMGEMIGNIAHQWRQPLTVISTGASGVKVKKRMGFLEDEDFNKTMDLIVSQTKYLSQTIDDFRDFIKDKNQQKKAFSLKETIEKAHNLISANLECSHIKFIQDIVDESEITGYQNELIQVLINIINNAKDSLVKNIKDERERFICIALKRNKSTMIIEVKDNGGGIPLDILPRVFEPYFTTKHQSVGTGIGLYMARDIIENHHEGTIDVVNDEFEVHEKIYVGAKFIITLKLV